MEELLTIHQVADRLHVHPKTVGEWLRSGRLHGLKAGILWRIPESALEDFLKKGEKEENND